MHIRCMTFGVHITYAKLFLCRSDTVRTCDLMLPNAKNLIFLCDLAGFSGLFSPGGLRKLLFSVFSTA